MERVEMIEELKRKIFRKIENREAIPEEIKAIIEKSFANLEELYQKIGCNNETIKEYIEETKEEVEAAINSNGENRKNIQFEEFQVILNRMQRKVEEQESIDNNMSRQEIEEVDFRDNEHSNRIIDIVNDALRDIQNRQNYILDSRGYSYERIEQINEYVNSYIGNVGIQQEENIKYYMKEDKQELISQIMQEYEDYIQYEKSEEEKKEQPNNEKEEFREGLNAGISLEEQHEFIEKRMNEEQMEQNEQNKENETKDLPGDLLL